jgi:hypothetical protein
MSSSTREGDVAVTDGLTRPATAAALRELARLHGLELSDAMASDLLPDYDQQQRWLAELRLVLGDEEEPATAFSAVGVRDGHG